MKRKTKNNKNAKFTRLVLIYFSILCILAVMIAYGVYYLFKVNTNDLPSPSELINYQIALPSKVYDCRGELIHTFATEQRALIKYRDLPQHLKDAITSTEDGNFYTHFGIDLMGTVRAAITNLKRGSASQGASTLSQQLSRNLFLSHERSWIRKIKEAMVTLLIEKEFSKEEIMEIYFNKVYIGEGVYGVGRAADYYFGKSVSDLTIGEAATLVGMLQRPNYFNPRSNNKRTRERRNLVIWRMYKTNKISRDKYDRERKSDLICVDRNYDDLNSFYLYYIGNEVAKKYGKKALYEDGLSIHLTLDWDLTQYADSLLNMQLTKIEDELGYEIRYSNYEPEITDIKTPYLQGGVFLIDAHTGHVKTMIGGRNFKHSKLNRIMQSRRQVGSSIKPIIYTAALEKGYTTATVIRDDDFKIRMFGWDRIPHLEDAPDSLLANQAYVDSLKKIEKKYLYSPSNYTKTQGGYMTLRKAVRNSFNIYAVKTMYDIGKVTVAKKADMFGLKVPPYYSSALGTPELKPVDMISAYTAFPNQGRRVKPIYIDKVYDKYGNILESSTTETVQVCEPDVAYLMTDLMKSVTKPGGTAGSSFSSPENREIYPWESAGKTGTTDDYKDAWFIGMNGKYVLGVWTGFDNYSALSGDSLTVKFDSLGHKVNGIGHGIGGGKACAPIASRILSRLIVNDNDGKMPPANDARYSFKRPENIVEEYIDPETGFRTLNKANGTKEVFSTRLRLPELQRPGLRYNFPPRYRYDDPNPLIVDELNN